MAEVSRAWDGWISFGATMLGLVGMLNIFRGVTALISDEQTVTFSENFVVSNVTAWGWTTLLSGVLLMVIGAGLFGRRTWARIAAIVVVMLHATAQVAWLQAYPIWALLMIGLDTVGLFALTARWSEQRADVAIPRDGSAAGRSLDSVEQLSAEATLHPR